MDEPVKIVQYNCTCGKTMKFESEHGVVAPQRTWVGLTHAEIDSQAKKDDHGVYFALGALWAEAKLKDKNK